MLGINTLRGLEEQEGKGCGGRSPHGVPTVRGERGAQRGHGWGMEGTAEPQRWWERWGARDCSTWQRCFWHVCSPFLIILRTLLTFKSQLCAVGESASRFPEEQTV